MDSISSKPNPWMVSTLLLAGVIIGFAAAQIPNFKTAGREAKVVTVTTPPAPSDAAKQKTEEKNLTADQIAKLADDDPVIGNPSAPITLVEFSDYQCPFCARFFKLTFQQIEENYIKTGKVKLVYRDFPLDFHPQALLAAEASQCSHEQGKFREMHDMLFNEQPQWAGNDKAKDLIKGYAKKLALDSKKFNECLDKNKYALEIRKDLIDGASIGVSGTPGFFINGKPLSGAMPYDTVFKPIFDAELDGKKWELQYDSLGKPSVKLL